MSDIAIKCEGLSKQYRIGEHESYKALRDVIAEAAATPFRRLRSALRNGNQNSAVSTQHLALVSSTRNSKLGTRNSIWALDDISLEVKRGEVVGIIGRNGAGKSTLLKILSRITKPTKGHAEIHGHVGSLLEVGTGFHPELTGRENIYLNAAILGMRKADVAKKFDEIVAFAEVEKFIDTPVKRYSSGMYVRLAFAVAAHLDPEILIIDEVLAVGDAAFQKKCLGKMGEVAHGGRTVLFVSHNMAAIQALSTRCVLLTSGKCDKIDVPRTVISSYMRQGILPKASLLLQGSYRTGNARLKIVDANVSNYEHPRQSICSGARLRVDVTILNSTAEDVTNIDVGFSFHDKHESNLCLMYSSYKGRLYTIRPGRNFITFIVTSPLLTGGQYFLGLRVMRFSEEIDWPRTLVPFDVVDDDYYATCNTEWRGWGAVLIEGAWLNNATESDPLVAPLNDFPTVG